jgi:hypothetical protein
VTLGSLTVLSRPLRWSLAGYAISIAGTSGTQGTLVAVAGLAGASSAFVPGLNLVDQALDWSAPAVARLVGSRQPLCILATAEAVDAMVSMAFAATAALVGVSVWLLLSYSAVTGVVAMAIDISGEVFVAEEAEGSHRQLVAFNSWISLVSVVAGSLAGRAGGTLLASRNLWAPFAANGVLSLIACGARVMAGRTRAACRSHPATLSQESHAERVAQPVTGEGRRRTGRAYQKLSFLVALAPAVWGAYLPLKLAHGHQVAAVSGFFAAAAIGQAVSAVALPRVSAMVSWRRLALASAMACPAALVGMMRPSAVALPLATALYFACLFALLNLMITARQLAFQGSALARLVGRCRIASSAGSLAGSAVGFVLYSGGDLIACLSAAIVMHVLQLLHLRTVPMARPSAKALEGLPCVP